MSFLYDAGLRIRPPQPMPECVEGESAQDYFARVLAECSLESATTAENASGDSAPTPFNIGQLQSDIAQAQEDIETLQTSDTEQQASLDAIDGQIATGVGTYALGDTTVSIAFPSSGTWRVFVMALGQALTTPFVNNVSATTAVVNFGAAGAAGSFNWLAVKS
jgi:hypothetical protein